MSESIIEFRGKAKRKDGGATKYVRRDGSTGESNRVTIFTVFNRDGKRGIQFEGFVSDALCKALGGTKDDYYFDLFAEDGGPKGQAAPKGGSDW